ncbi:hypothetical protein [Pantoea agglomerans]|uniref:hypothetical protein n=1 Tax=Enterobacter agglomerans TaxID=549 RepID=UPI003C7B36A9
MIKIIFASLSIIVSAVIYIGLKNYLEDVPTSKVTAGTLENVNVSRGLVFSDSDTSELVLSDGTHITVKGAVNNWRRGSEVSHLVPTGKADNRNKTDSKWCIGDECFWQK